jgi:hypothetical protein
MRVKRFENLTLFPEITNAIAIAEHLLLEPSALLAEVRGKEDFKFESGPGYMVAARLQRGPGRVLKVFTYSPWNPWTKAIGYFNGEDIFINKKVLPRMSLKDIVANLCHEYAHACGFHHDNNYKTDIKVKQSVPYFISENIGRWI